MPDFSNIAEYGAIGVALATIATVAWLGSKAIDAACAITGNHLHELTEEIRGLKVAFLQYLSTQGGNKK